MLEQGGRWKGILLLSMIVPMGLLTGLKLSGINQPTTIDVITLNPVVWQFNRTTEFTVIDVRLNATYADNAGQMNFSVQPGTYECGNAAIPACSLNIGIGFTIIPLSRDFFVTSTLVTFGKDPQPSLIALLNTYISFENLTLTDFSDGEQARVQLLGNSSQGGVYCEFSAVWFLHTPNNVTSQRQIDFEITYFNGTAYKRAVQPFDLTLLGS